MELNWHNMKRIMLIVAFGVVLYVGLMNYQYVTNFMRELIAIVFPFLLGSCIAFVINIPMKVIETKWFRTRNRRKRKQEEAKKSVNTMKRVFAILLSFIAIVAVVVLLLTLLIPELVNVVRNFITYLTTLPSSVSPYLNELVEEYPWIGEEVSKLQLDFSNILNTVISFLSNAGTGLMTWVGKTVSFTISGVFNAIIGLIFAFYLLMSKEKIGRQLRRMTIAYLPEKYANKVLEIASMSREAFTKFISGQLKEAIILGVLCYIGMTILRLPYSLTISLLATVTALIPIFGAFIGATVGVILLVAVSPMKALIFLVFIIVLQQIETNIIYPHVVGDSVGLPGVIVLVAITIGGSLWGVVGMLISLPIASVIYTLLRANVNKRLQEKNREE